MDYLQIFNLVLFCFFVVYFRLYLHLFPKNKLPILMYHSVQNKSTDALVIPVKNLEEQLAYLNQNNYNTLFFKDLNGELTTRNNIILTFDDGYRDNLEYLLPLLKKYKQKAVIFVNTSFVNEAGKMSFSDMKNADPEHLEIALHSHAHKNFAEIPLSEAKQDLLGTMQKLDEHGINYQKVFAYPYGRYPKNNPEFYKMLEEAGIRYALRIGNRLNYYPFKNKFQVCRIGIDGTDSLSFFKIKLIFGKLKF